MAEELKACPFCGGTKIKKNHDEGQFWNTCQQCFADGPPTSKRSDEGAPDWNTRAKPSQGGEAVEVVCITQGGCNVTWTATKELTPAGTELMSVRQHQRILAAATHPADQVAEGVVVPRELLVRLFNYSDKRMPVEIDDLHELRQLLAKSEGVKK